MPSATAWRFSTGNAPGRPNVTGSVCVLGSLPNSVEEPLKKLRLGAELNVDLEADYGFILRDGFGSGDSHFADFHWLCGEPR